MKSNKFIIISILMVSLMFVPWLVNNYPGSRSFIDNIFSYIDNFASIILRDVVTIDDLHNKYNQANFTNNKIKILIVPGHEPGFGGAEYGNIKERELTVELADNLSTFLKSNNHYEVMVSRNDTDWNPILKNYFNNNWENIISFFKQRKNETIELQKNGSMVKIMNGVKHNPAPVDVAYRLYGMNKWVNENNIDIVIHIHLNDYPRNRVYTPGEYSGFSIYVPERQYVNSTTTKAIADTVFKRLSKYNAVSNMPKEKDGITEDQDLIAIGSYNTLDAPSMLIEYGYIYENQFTDGKVREVILKDLAFQTYLGLQDFFGGANDVSVAYDTLMLPHSWNENIDKRNAINNKSDILALQVALANEGLYPVNGKTKNDCPITGVFGPCTQAALSKYQHKYGIRGEENILGDKTIGQLNNLYSVRLK